MLDSMKRNAERFDNNYIKQKTQNIYCSNGLLIYDYLLLKSITSKRNLTILIMTNGVNDRKLVRTWIFRELDQVGLKDKLIKHTLSDKIKFKNGNKIQIVNYDADWNGGKIDILFIRNTCLSETYYSATIDNFKNLLRGHGRSIYNFDI